LSLKELIADIYPLSPMQEGMLFHTLLAPHSGVYFLQTSCVLEGNLDPDAFQSSWRAAVDRHPVLRTGFLWENLEKPVQVIYKRTELPVDILDWRHLTAGAQREERRLLLAGDRRRGFDPAAPPLLRLLLLRLAEDLYELVFSYHHLLLDAWSGPQLLEEIFGEYAALRQGTSYQPPSRRPFRDYIAWLQAQDMAAAEAFWRRELEGFTAPTPLVSDRPPAGAPTAADAYGTLTLSLPREDGSALQALARRCQVTLNTLVQGAWALLLHRYTGERDILFGVVVSGRPADLAGAESMIGLFINTLPARIRIEPEAPLLDWWRRLQAHQVELRQLEHSPLVQVQGWSQVPYGLPLFESLFIFANYPTQALGDLPGGLTIRRSETTERTNYPLTVEARADDEIQLKMYYELERFDTATIDRMLRHLARLASAAAADPERRLRDLPLLTGAELHQLLAEWNDGASRGVETTLHRWLSEQAARRPEAVALISEGDALTYGELERRTNRLARHLRGLGVGPETLVGLCIDRSPEMVVGILGILKAGGAYVPLDPDLPKARLALMLEDCVPPLVLTRERFREILPEGTPVLCLEAAGPRTGEQPEDPLPDLVLPESPAYVIYTSGSTGRPKGTLVTHANVTRLMAATEDWFGFGPGDVWTLFHSYAFDFSVWEIWGALLYGGRLVMVPYSVSRSPEAFHDLLAREGVTVLNQTPSAFRQLVQVEEEADVPPALALRYVVFGGEAVDMPGLGPWLARHGDQRPRLINMYGITETTVHVTYRPLGVADLDSAGRSPIGKPIPDLELHLLDGELRLLPVGAPGEIHVAGAGLARGYLGRPELTAERFIPHPLGRTPGARLYRSGDLGRRLPDGGVEYLGRIDHQVKIRGFRIELGEVEAALAGHPGVRQAVVAVRRDRPDESRLVAYVVPAEGGAPATGELRRFLRESLPDYMVPAAFVILDRLPLTATGKLDRAALPPPESLRPGLETDFVAPQSEMERRIAAVWCSVLGVERLGVHDNFFDLGGHSLAMVKAVGRLRRELGVEVSVVAAFQHPSIQQLAAHLSQVAEAPTAAERREVLAQEAEKGGRRLRQRFERQQAARERQLR
jgi:amino acid adenylation domain-containing protein